MATAYCCSLRSSRIMKMSFITIERQHSHKSLLLAPARTRISKIVIKIVFYMFPNCSYQLLKTFQQLVLAREIHVGSYQSLYFHVCNPILYNHSLSSTGGKTCEMLAIMPSYDTRSNPTCAGLALTGSELQRSVWEVVLPTLISRTYNFQNCFSI